MWYWHRHTRIHKNNFQTRDFSTLLAGGYFFLIILSCLTLATCPAARAGQMLIINSAPIKPYQEAIAGFNKGMADINSYRGVISIQPISSTVIDLNKSNALNTFNQKYQELQVDLVLAVGSRALNAALTLQAPVVYVMAVNPQTMIKGKSNITGVMLPVEPARQLAAIRAYMPAAKRIGLLVSQGGQKSPLTKGLKAAASGLGLTAISETAESPRAVGKALEALKGKIDLLWLPPDKSILTPASLNVFTLFSVDNHIPLIAFAPKYLRHGALMAIFASPAKMGAQAAELAGRILAGTSPSRIKPEYAKDAEVLINPKIAAKLGVQIAQPQPN